MKTFPFQTIPERLPCVGLVVLQADETLEADMRAALGVDQADVFVSRVPSGLDVTPETLAAMEGELTRAASLFPPVPFDIVAYGCTSGASVIGADVVSAKVQAACETHKVTDPVSALVEACERRKVRRLALLSPYREDVNRTLRAVLAEQGIATPVFGSFNESRDAVVARIDEASIVAAACALAKDADVDAIFLSCTNLKTRNILSDIERQTGLPTLSSNSVLVEACRLAIG